MDFKVTELEVKNVYQSDDVKTVVVGFLGRNSAPYQVSDLIKELLRRENKVTDLQAGADDSDEGSRVQEYSGITTNQIEAKLGSLSVKITKVVDIERLLDSIHTTRRRITLTGLQAAADDQQEFEFSDADTVYCLEAGAAFEYDYDEAAEVLDSLQGGHGLTVSRLYATGASPKKIVGDLAQASILTANGQEQIIGLSEWSIDWKRKTVEATTTDDALYESSLGSTKSWSAKAKFMFIDGDQSQVDGVLAAVDTLALDSITWNFFPTVESQRAAFQGGAIIDGITIASGMGKLVGLDVSLKGTGPLKRLTQAAPVANPNTVTGQTAQV